MKRPPVQGVWAQDVPEGVPQICVGTVTSRSPGSARARVRMTIGSGQSVRNAIAADGIEFQAGDRVLIARMEDAPNWVVIGRVLDTSEVGGRLGKTLAERELHPPSNFVVTSTVGAIVGSWDCWSGATVCWEIQHNDTATTTNASTAYTRGAYFFYFSTVAATRYIRVRGIRYDPNTGMAYYSRWTSWKSGSSSSAGSYIKWGNVWIVAKTGGDYTTIIQAEGACDSGDTILVMPGDYQEDLVIDQAGVTLTSLSNHRFADGLGTRIVGTGSETDPLLTNSGGATISNFLLEAMLSDLAVSQPSFMAAAMSEPSNVFVTDTRIEIDGGSTSRNVIGLMINSAPGGESLVRGSNIFAANVGAGGAVEVVGGKVVLESCEIDGRIFTSNACSLYLRNCTVNGNVTDLSGAGNLYLEGVCHITGSISGWSSITGETIKGAPLTMYSGTEAAVEATFSTPGMVAYATDSGDLGHYDGVGAQWVWGSAHQADTTAHGRDLRWYIDGALVTATEVGGAYIVTDSDFSVIAAYIYCKDSGSAGTTTVDIHLNGVTIFTTQASRPQLAWDDADGVAKSATPDITALTENDVITVDIDAVATGAEGLTVVLALSGAT